MKLTLLHLIVLVFAFLSCSNPSQIDEYGQGEDYVIYQTVINENHDASGAIKVLYDSTASVFVGNRFDSSRAAYLKGNLPGLTDETVADFLMRNEDHKKLDYVIGVHNLIMARDYADKGNKNAVHVTLSRVGYDASKTQAIVEAGWLWAPLAGSGEIVFLTKVNGEWKIEGRCMVWIA